jgi:hypothetical protein
MYKIKIKKLLIKFIKHIILKEKILIIIIIINLLEINHLLYIINMLINHNFLIIIIPLNLIKNLKYSTILIKNKKIT